MEIVNWKLLGHPLNWVVLFLMVFIGTLAIHFIVTYQLSPKLNAK